MGLRHALALVAALGLLLAGSARPAEGPPVTLRIVFPEGFTVRKMADRIYNRLKANRRSRSTQRSGTASAFPATGR